jgi:laminin alpha 3/5
VTGTFQATLHPCRYTSICRQVVTETNGKVAVLNFPTNYATIILDGESNNEVAVKSVVAIQAEDWSVDYLNPKSVCVRKDGKCIQGMFPEAPDAKKIELEQNNQILDAASTPEGVYDNSSKFIYLNSQDVIVDIPAKVPHPGDYVFVVQYYQPDYPEFSLDVLVQNGKFYEAKVPMAHCPSNSGCRSLVRQLDGKLGRTSLLP